MPSQALIELLRGKGAHADPLACVEDLSAQSAARQVEGFPHSIGQLVFHINYWMSYELRRIRGERPRYPEHAAESFPAAGTPRDAAEWDRLRRDFAWLLAEYAELAKSSPEEMQRQIASTREADQQMAGTLEAVLWQMIVHTSYHVGQIAMVRRVLGAWPPKAGGDTW
jgi:uncharacterized damage-inducible protein DinB